MVVTGGSRGLGAAIAERLLRDGVTVVSVSRSRDVSGIDESLRGSLITVAADVLTDDVVEGCIALEASSDIRLEGWVNCAHGGTRAGVLPSAIEPLEPSLLPIAAMIRLTSRFSDHLIEHDRRGSIVNIASMYAHIAPDPTLYSGHESLHSPVTYGSSKAAVVQFSRYAATHLASFGIRVNSVSPGPFPSTPAAMDPSFVAMLEQRVPLERVGSPAEIAGIVSFLLSDDASYVTGSDIRVDGGWTCW